MAKKQTWIEGILNDPSLALANERERALMEVTENIAILMEKEGVNRSELAHRMNRSAAFVSKVLSGHQNLTISTLVNVFSSLNRSIHIGYGSSTQEIELTNECDYEAADFGWHRLVEKKAKVKTSGLSFVDFELLESGVSIPEPSNSEFAA